MLGKIRRMARGNLWRVEWYAKRQGWSARGLSRAAHFLCGRPSSRLTLVGVTGTNGKTTTAWLMQEALERLGTPCGLLSTVEVRTGLRTAEAWLTTPNSIDLPLLMREMIQGGCLACSMEVSSHALKEYRPWALNFDVGIFTNFTEEHLDYHRSMKDYAASKMRLFENLGPTACAVLNRDDPLWQRIAQATAAKVVTFGKEQERGGATIAGSETDVSYRILGDTPEGLDMIVDGERRRFRLAAAFNGANLAGAYAALRFLGHPGPAILDALAAIEGPPGRMEVYRSIESSEDRPLVIVDFAHTPDALENLLKSARRYALPGARIILIFGSDGDRQWEKRPVMGRIGAQLADSVVLTSNNSRSEDPNRISEQIIAGMHVPPVAVIQDRRVAVLHGIGLARPGDIVLVVGRGHERTQEIMGVRVPSLDHDHVLACGYESTKARRLRGQGAEFSKAVVDPP